MEFIENILILMGVDEETVDIYILIFFIFLLILFNVLYAIWLHFHVCLRYFQILEYLFRNLFCIFYIKILRSLILNVAILNMYFIIIQIFE